MISNNDSENSDTGTPVLNNLLQERQLPDVLQSFDGSRAACPADWARRRLEILDLLRREIYGFAPAAPASVVGQITENQTDAFANKAIRQTVVIEFPTPGGKFAFSLTLIVPKQVKRAPVFLAIAFRPNIPDIYLPAEEIVDNGFAVATFCYNDISPDENDRFAKGLPALYPRDEQTGWGKISVWAWAASRVMDYLQTRDDLDPDHVAVIGHSRLGKTALWCGAQDERFATAISNDSGCAGAALFRGKSGERIEAITRVFPYWFCGRFPAYAEREDALPFDQHFLISLIAPRAVYIGSAAEDDWADPHAEFLAALAASPVYRLLGYPGLVTPDRLPEPGTILQDGRAAYHLRTGSHFLSRSDWQIYMANLRRNQ